MGWFDNEQEAATQKVGASPSAPRPAAKPPAQGAETGSTLGREVHIDGTIVCGEDLTILGRVEGTIRAQGTLVIAKEADVSATIDGQRVLVHGRVNGNVHGAERVVLGQTARLTGNIEAPALEIIEGAYFKGNVEMRPEEAGRADKATAPSKAAPAKSKGAAQAGETEESPSGISPGAASAQAASGGRGAKAGQAAS